MVVGSFLLKLEVTTHEIFCDGRGQVKDFDRIHSFFYIKMMNIPLNVPICLKAHTGNNLQNEFVWRTARCNNQGTGSWEQMVLIQSDDNKIMIQSRWNGRYLQVQGDGFCVFANHEPQMWEKFTVECDMHGNVYFISCHTGNVLQCDQDGRVRCVNQNRLGWEAWTLVCPKTSKMLTSSQLQQISLGVAGAVLLPGLGLAMAAMVPRAMSTFGTVVAGVGTFHAPVTSFGCAAVLQASSAALVSVPAAVAGGIAGIAVARAFDKHEEDEHLYTEALQKFD